LVDACRGEVDNAFLVRYILRVGVALLFRARDGEDDSSDEEEEEEERTVLDLAAQRGHAGICRELVNHEHYEDINWADSEGTTALHRAAFHFQPGVASVLLDAERFTETNAITSYGWSALHAAVPQKPPGSDEQENIIQAYDVCKLLLEHPRFTAVNLRDTECGLSVLDKAAYSGHANICALFLGSGRFTEVSSTDSAGRTALHQMAAFTGGLPPQCVLDVCRTIISDGRIDLHKKDKWGDAAYEELKRQGYHAACALFPQHEAAEDEPLDGEANSVDELGDGPHQGDQDDDEAMELLHQMLPGSVVRVTDEVNLMLEACRRANFDLTLDERRVMAAGKLGRVIKTDADDLTVKVKVLDIGVTWLPVQALQPIRHSTMDAGVPEASSSDDSSNGSTEDEQWDDET